LYLPSFRAALATLPISLGGLFGLRQLVRSHLQVNYTPNFVHSQLSIYTKLSAVIWLILCT